MTSESASPEVKGRSLALVFSMQGIGFILAAAVFSLMAAAGASFEFMWRFGLLFGAVPPLLVIVPRWRMQETNTFAEMQAERAAVNAVSDAAGRGTAGKGSQCVSGFVVAMRSCKWHLLGTAGSWFLFDVVFYAQGLFESEITGLMDLGEDLASEARVALIIGFIALPGYFLSVCFLNRLGRKVRTSSDPRAVLRTAVLLPEGRRRGRARGFARLAVPKQARA